MSTQIIGPIKVKDGLFMGDKFAAQVNELIFIIKNNNLKDFEFVISNKITHIINCAGREMSNVWENAGIAYLTFPWVESDSQVII